MHHDLLFNGYSLAIGTRRKFDASLADSSIPLPEGDYWVGKSPAPRGIIHAFENTRLNVRYSINKDMSREYPLTPVGRSTDQRLFYLIASTVPRCVAGVRVLPTFFQSADPMLSRGGLNGKVLRARYSAPWMQTAAAELGQSEVGGPKANSRILEDFVSSKYWGKDDSGAKNAWCGSFVAWVMARHGYEVPPQAYRAKGWSHFGKQITRPVYGAIGIKSRKGGGHVAFVAGKSSNGKHLYMLGGNQQNEVNVSRYDRDSWDTFVVPKAYIVAGESLPNYTKRSKQVGSES